MSPAIDTASSVAVEGLHASVAGHPVLEDITFSIDAGEFVAIVGKSGAGKSTLATCLLGLAGRDVRITAGTVLIDGTDLYALDEDERTRLRRRLVGYAPQRDAFVPDLDAWENVTLAADLSGVAVDEEAVRWWMERLDVLECASTGNNKLSGGQKQRLNLVRALHGDPAMLVLDEPTAGLDPAMRDTVNDALRTLARDEHKLLVVITHDTTAADRLLRLDAGRLVTTEHLDYAP